MGCNNSKIVDEKKINTEIEITPVVNEIKEIPISNEIKKLNIKINIIRPNPMTGLEENKNLRIKIPSNT
jgi:hypothetical protein